MMYTITLGTEIGDIDCQVVLQKDYWTLKGIYRKYDNYDLRLSIDADMFQDVTDRLDRVISAMREDRCVL